MRELNKLAVTGVIIGTDGFELGDVEVLIQASEGNDLSLLNTKIWNGYQVMRIVQRTMRVNYYHNENR